MLGLDKEEDNFVSGAEASVSGGSFLSRLKLVLAGAFFSWCLAQSLVALSLPLADVLGTYAGLASDYFYKLLLFFLIGACTFLLLYYFSLRLGRDFPRAQLSYLSLQFLFTAMSLRSPFVSLSLGLFMLEIALFFLIWRHQRRKKVLALISAGFLGLSFFKLLYILLFQTQDLSRDSRFRYFYEHKVNFTLSLRALTFLIVFILLTAVLILLLRYRGKITGQELGAEFSSVTEKLFKILLIAAVSLLWLLLAWIMLGRVLRMRTPCYDMGIFTQIYHGMLRTGQALSTVERDKLLSHFAVHFSPILYLLLPVFYLFPSQMTLQLLQLIIAASAVIPLRRILRRLDFPKRWTFLLSALLLASPQLIGSNMYDFHENCFLAPLLLFLIDGILRKSRWQTLLFSLLTLMVKEDAAVYVFALGLWAVFAPGQKDENNKELFKGRIFHILSLLFLPLLWFLFATFMIGHFGGEPMLSRFSNLNAFPDKGFSGIILTFILHPAPAIAGSLTPGKVFYLLTVLASVGFLPFLQKRAVHYLLFIPLLVINLLSNWSYQHQLNFQYGYGSGVLLFFALLLFICDLRGERGFLSGEDRLSESAAETKTEGKVSGSSFLPMPVVRRLLAAATAFAIIFSFINLLEPRLLSWQYTCDSVQEANAMREILAEVPRDKKILTTSRFVAELADVAELYVIEYHGEADPEIDLIVVENLPDNQQQNEWLEEYEALGYKVSPLSANGVLLLTR